MGIGVACLLYLRGSAPVDAKRRVLAGGLVLGGLLFLTLAIAPGLHSWWLIIGLALAITLIGFITYRRISFCLSCGRPSFLGSGPSYRCSRCLTENSAV